MPDRKINFCSKFVVKISPAAVAHADNGRLTSLSLFYFKYLDHMLVKIWTKLYGPNYTKFELFWQKTGFFKIHFWRSVDAILEDVSVAETSFNAKLLISRLPSFSVSKITVHSKKLLVFFTVNRKIYYTYFNAIFTVYRIFIWEYRKKIMKISLLQWNYRTITVNCKIYGKIPANSIAKILRFIVKKVLLRNTLQ